MKYRLSYEFEEEIEADSKEQAMELLENRIGSENKTVEAEFWDGLKIEEVG